MHIIANSILQCCRHSQTFLKTYVKMLKLGTCVNYMYSFFCGTRVKMFRTFIPEKSCRTFSPSHYSFLQKVTQFGTTGKNYRFFWKQHHHTDLHANSQGKNIHDAFSNWRQPAWLPGAKRKLVRKEISFVGGIFCNCSFLQKMTVKFFFHKFFFHWN